MDNKITTIRIHEEIKTSLDTLKEHERETYEQLLIRLIKYIKERETIQ